jgi:hypothetical protein
MILWLVLKLEISYNRVIIISWRILVSFRGFFTLIIRLGPEWVDNFWKYQVPIVSKVQSPIVSKHKSLNWKYLEIYVLRNLSWLQIWGCCKDLWIEWKLVSGLRPEQIWEEAKESKKRPIARENSPLVRSFLPWLVCCTRVILVALSNNTEILHEILVCWIWPLGPHKNNNNNFFCKSATTSSTSADKHASTKSPFYHHPTPFVIPVILPWHFDLIPISNFLGGVGGGEEGPLKEDKSFFSFWRRKLRGQVSVLCVSELSSLMTKI